jgi:hypothetical protein
MKWELYPRYAEQETVIIEAATFEEAEKKAATLARRGKVSLGYLPNGSLCPVEAR